jgi:hypothetical protein
MAKNKRKPRNCKLSKKSSIKRIKLIKSNLEVLKKLTTI